LIRGGAPPRPPALTLTLSQRERGPLEEFASTPGQASDPLPSPLPLGEAGERSEPGEGRSRVMLWPDTFNNYFYPDTAKAAVEVLEAAGFEVVLPPKALCCGRPLYDYGMLDTAREWLREILDVLRSEIRAGVPIVGLEPSCVAVFRDELGNLLPHDEDARRLGLQVFTLAEFLQKRAPHWEPPRLEQNALLHGHCHQQAILKLDHEVALLRRMGVEPQIPDAGCCGLAGSFGFEREHYDLSMRAGERALLPAVRATSPDTLLIADGFSCREQVSHGTGRRPLHLAEVLQRALHDDVAEPSTNRPTSGAGRRLDGHRVLIWAGALAVGALIGWRLGRSALGHR
jgi:Fe-S oxidoreductase